MKSFFRKLNRWAPWPVINIVAVMMLFASGMMISYREDFGWFLLPFGVAGLAQGVFGWRADVRDHLRGRR